MFMLALSLQLIQDCFMFRLLVRFGSAPFIPSKMTKCKNERESMRQKKKCHS